jgi:CoA:oxalate CoA-transferase
MDRQMRVLDISSGVGAAYSSKLLAEFGWDVVKVEAASGDPLRTSVSRWGGAVGGAFEFVNQGKRSIAGLSSAQVHELAAQADVVVGDFSEHGLAAVGLEGDLFASLMPRFAVVSVSAFGLAGPRSSWVDSDLIVQAASGLLYMTGESDQPPMQLAPYQAALLGGAAGAAAALVALRIARRSDEVVRTEVSSVEAMTSFAYAAISAYVHRGEVTRREQRIKAGLRMVPAADRFVYCAPGAVASMRMDGIAELLEEPRLAAERFQSAEGRMENNAEFLELFVPPFMNRTAQEWFERAEAMHMTFALVQTIDDLFECPQLGAREFLRDLEGESRPGLRLPGRPFRIADEPVLALRRAPASPGIDSESVLASWSD